ncbi:MAG: UDP-N-acetylmuramoyl-tripeptide--D-alanyl-D-alanine ligase [Clostridium sp.]
MENLTLLEIKSALNGEVFNFNEDSVIKGVSTDTRTISHGDVFVALKGENFNGNKFVNLAKEKGAILAIVSEDIEEDIPYIKVEDTLVALGKIASFYKNKFNLPMIAVTGSVGKTSTKEVIASMLSESFNVHKTDKNFNNEIGLPKTLFNLNSDHQVSVVEMGMNNFHEIERLSLMARPNIGVITNIGTAHIENLGSKEGILKAKMEITSSFDSNSVLIVNGDDEYLKNIQSDKYKVVKVTVDSEGDYRGYDIKNLGEEGVEFKILFNGREETIRINALGVYNVYNALAAIAIGDMLSMDINDMKEGIAKFLPCGMRMKVYEGDNNIKIIADCYNANPESMKSSLEVLKSFKGSRKIAVLGDMFELGDYSENGHRSTGIAARESASMLIAVGNSARFIYEEAKDYIDSKYFSSKEEAEVYIKNNLKSEDVLLLKASRGMKMETILDYILKDTERGN